MKNNKILIVDDEVDYTETIKTVLELNGFSGRVDVTRNGAEALDYLFGTDHQPYSVKNIPGIILLDINMPKIDGLQTLLTIRDVEATKDIPVVMLTSSINREDMERAIKFGANGYLIKPIDIENLLSLIRTHIN